MQRLNQSKKINKRMYVWSQLQQGYDVNDLIFWSLANGVKGLESPGNTSGITAPSEIDWWNDF